MSKPLSVLKDLAGAKAQDTSSATANKMDGWMNQFYEELWRNFNWKEITVIDEAFTMTASTVRQVLPKQVGQILVITERSTNAVIQPSSPFVYQERYLAGLAANASPIGYTDAGRIGVETNLSTADTIRIVSSSANDTHIVRVTGEDASGLYRSDPITLNGTSNVDGAITFAADKLIDVVQAQRSTGVITISETTSATVLDRIGPEDYTNEYPIIYLQSPAASAYTGYISYKERFRPMRYAEDIPRFACGEALILYAVAQVLKTRGKYDQALVEEGKANDLVGALVGEKKILGLDYEETIPKIATARQDVPYFVNGRF